MAWRPFRCHKTHTAPCRGVPVHLDDLDAAIVRTLLTEGRSSHRDIAQRLGTTPTTVGARIRRLEELGLLFGVAARVDPGRSPGHVRLLEGAAGPDAPRILDGARHLAGVIEAVVTGEGRLVVVAHVSDLDDEERLMAALRAAGASGLVTVGARRASGPPPVHLFAGPVGIEEACSQCGRRTSDPLVLRIDDRRVPFCCPSCRDLYGQRYAKLRAGAKR